MLCPFHPPGMERAQRKVKGVKKSLLRRFHRHKAARSQQAQFLANPYVFWAGAVTEPILRILADAAELRNSLPEPFDVFDHAGNLGEGMAIAGVAVIIKQIKESQANKKVGKGSSLTPQQLRTFRRRWVPAVMALTMIVNTLTETKWGIETFPVEKLFPNTTPDPLDALYSTAAAGLFTAFAWKRRKGPSSPFQPSSTAQRQVSSDAARHKPSAGSISS